MTINNLYNNLHRRTSGWDEDFLTEAFVHLLRFLQENEPKFCYSLLKKITGTLLDQVDADISEIDISTQFYTKTSGTPDIHLKHPDFLVFIEVKVDADFHDGQLEGYRSYLDESGIPIVKLITLTRYGQSGDKSEVDLAVRWNQIADWLEHLTLSDEIAIFLRNGFIEFLQQRGVAMDKVEWDLVSGTKSLLSLINMILEALSAAQITKDATTAGKNWQGYLKKYGKTIKIFMGIYLAEPAKVCVEIQNATLREDLEVSRGEIANGKWTDTLDLSSEEVHFFARSKQRQLACLEEFLSESVEYAEKLIKEHCKF